MAPGLHWPVGLFSTWVALAAVAAPALGLPGPTVHLRVVVLLVGTALMINQVPTGLWRWHAAGLALHTLPFANGDRGAWGTDVAVALAYLAVVDDPREAYRATPWEATEQGMILATD